MVDNISNFPREEQPALKGGRGTVELVHILSRDQLGTLGRLFGISIIPPGGSIGEHRHTGDFEVYYFLRGSGRINDNGHWHTVGPGDVAVCPDGGFHALENAGEDNLEYIAAILNSK